VKIINVVGARPNLMKIAPLMAAYAAAPEIEPLLVHTGQHYDANMSELFFRQLGIPEPDLNLEVGSASHAVQTAEIMRAFEPIVEQHRPDAVLVVGDVNSTIACGLVAVKLGVRLVHVEAGLRSFDRTMPEEINRILTDHLSDHLFAPTGKAHDILRGEGIPAARIHVTGNTVVDELILQRPRAERAELFTRFQVAPGRYALATIHRPENTDDPARLGGILRGVGDAAKALGLPVLAPLHPRTTARLAAFGLDMDRAIRVLPPLGYLDFLGLLAGAALTLTDSGGLQEEACCLRVSCVTLRDSTERPESVDVGANLLAGAEPARIVDAARRMHARSREWPNPFGDGASGLQIVDALRALAR
jgi:UDP-N-acetylglucosamine 2-epimerase (non-hydrolysing)